MINIHLFDDMLDVIASDVCSSQPKKVGQSEMLRIWHRLQLSR